MFGPVDAELDDVSFEEEVECPFEGDLDAAGPAGHFHQIDGPPEPPGGKS